MNRSLSYDCPMTLRSVMLQLREDQIARLDAQAAGIGVSRSKLVRDAVDASLDRPLIVDVAVRYATAYPDADAQLPEPDDWGDLEAWHEAAARQRRGDPSTDGSAGGSAGGSTW